MTPRIGRRVALGSIAATAVVSGGRVLGLPRDPRPEDHGAIGDGIADDTLALRAFLEASHDVYHLTPGRTYAIRPQARNEVILPLRHGVRLVGQGARLRVMDGSDPFGAILGSFDAQTDLSDLTIETVIFDHNARRGQAFTERGGVLVAGHMTVATLRGTRLRFVDNQVVGAASTNCVYFNGNGATGDILVSGNNFTDIGRTPNRLYHDHSTLYLTGDGISVRDNRFEAAEWGVEGAVCAIEVHPGYGCRIENNVVDRFLSGMNFAGIHQADSRRGRITGNRMDVLRAGIALFSGQYAEHKSGYGIDGLVIDDNSIRVRNASPKRYMAGGGTSVGGIGIAGGSSLPVRDVLIGSGNALLYDPEVARSDWDGIPVAVGVNETGGEVVYENIVIGDVRIENAPGIGIALGLGGGTLLNCRVGRPMLSNVGNGAFALLDFYRTALWVSPARIRGTLTVQGARVIDRRTGSKLNNALFVSTGLPSPDSRVEIGVDVRRGRRASLANLAYVGSSHVVPRVTLTTDTAQPAAPVGRFAAGSSIRDVVGKGRATTDANGRWRPA